MWNSLRKEQFVRWVIVLTIHLAMVDWYLICWSRGWCNASESYETCKQLRCIVDIPKIFTFLCGETTAACVKHFQNQLLLQKLQHQAHQGKSPPRAALTPIRMNIQELLKAAWYSNNGSTAGGYLPSEMEIAIHCDATVSISDSLSSYYIVKHDMVCRVISTN